MKTLRVIAAQLIGLFVDDGSFALAIVAWLAACWLVLPRLGLAPALPPIILFLGLAGILAATVVRRVGRKAP